MSIITKKSAGILFIFSIPFISAFSLTTEAPFYIALALLFAVSICLLFLAEAEAGLLVLIATRPTIELFSDKLKIDLYNGISINIMAPLGLFVIFFAMVFVIINLINKKISAPPFILILSILLFLIINTVSIFISINPLMTIYEIIRLFSIFSIFILSYLIISTKNNYYPMLWAILISSIIPMILALFQFITGTGVSDIEGRLLGTFSNPNSFASFSVLILGILTYLFLSEKDTKKRFLYASSALFVIFILLETLSRGAWLATLIFTFSIIIWKSPKVIFVIIFSLLALFFLSETFHDRIEDVYNPPATSSVRWRFKQWENLFKVYENKPLTGYGAGTEILIHEKEFGFYAGNPYAHNDILRAALEAGFFGALSFLSIFLSVTITCLKNYNKTFNKKHKLLIIIIVFLFISEFIFGMTSNIFRSTAVQWCLWALIGVSLVKKWKPLINASDNRAIS